MAAVVRSGEIGSSLVEVLVALAILVVTFTGVAQVCVLAVAASVDARAAARASVTAGDKLEALSALGWDADAPLPEGLALAPPDALERNVEGFFEYVSRDGTVLGPGDAPPRGAAVIRRWGVFRVAGDADQSLLMHVAVQPLGRVRAGPVQLFTIRTRMSPW